MSANAPLTDENDDTRQWAVRDETGRTCHASEDVARAAVTEGGYTLGPDRSPIVAVLTRTSPDGEWQMFADKVAFRCGPRCDHGEAPHLYLNAIDPDRCAACAAWPSLPCAQHREVVVSPASSCCDLHCPTCGHPTPGGTECPTPEHMSTPPERTTP